MTVSQIDSFVSALKLFKEPVFHPAKASVYEELGIWAQKYDRQDLALACAQAASDTDEAEAEFNRMCIGPYRLTVPPYESVWRTGRRVLNNRFSAAVQYSYEEIGLAVGDMNEPVDFFGYELEFCYATHAFASAYEKEGKTQEAELLREAASRFWAEHLGHWAGKFLEAMQQDARHPFWRAWTQALSELLTVQHKDIALSNTMSGEETTAVVQPPRSLHGTKDSI